MSALRPVAVGLVVACTLMLAATAQAHRSPSPMVDEINKVRGAHGLRALHYSPSLARSSSRYVRYMVRTGRFAHSARIMAGGRFSQLGEILALTPGREVQRERTLGNWLSSPSHRAVLMSASFRYIGAARRHSDFGGDGVVWAAHFGR